ncbi:peptidase family M1-domain-containing protein [Mycena rosella]|uniref:Peptidase family M1-domain-containing protein n=1 Tax=Mycena rosella TaxID=1033263 RepID=A0AAD7BCI4_MYCRO|nr:peptidase family M1-domain-containing protein [Mycena rosella]
MLDLDPTTQSNYWQIASEHVTFDWSVDFAAQIVSGSATHRMNVLLDGVEEAIFDTGDLDVTGAEVKGSAVPFAVKPKHEVMRSALHVSLPKGLKSGTSVDVTVFYKTTKDCTALQWLEKEQTQGKQFPYLFSQCQPIYAALLRRPSVKITYSATVAPSARSLSAIRVSPPSDGPAHDGKVIGKDIVKYTYDQPVPIPSYLLAIACGNPELIDAAYWEFSEDTARLKGLRSFVQVPAAEEKIVTPYKFGTYDLLVLPPSFPYGGMENACLSFLTPTLLTGDRTLVDVVVHEATHSWFGNGVTHAHATHFWLNEGWTVYMERLLLQVLHDSPAARGFSFIIGAKALVDDLARGEDPDDAYSRCQRTLGGLEVFLPYVKDYQWKAHLYEYYAKHGGPEKVALLDSVDWQAWLYGEGLKLPAAYALADRWDAARASADTANQRCRRSPAHITHLGTLYALSSSPNAEIRLRFYAAKWVVGADGTGVIKGRMKFCRPIFKAVFKVNSALALETWAMHKAGFHPIAKRLIDKDLGLYE